MVDKSLSPDWARTLTSGSRPYPPSWLDRLTDWVESLSVPAWLIYGIVALLLPTLYSILKWFEGTYPLGAVEPFLLFNTGVNAYIVAMMHYLDKSAASALAKFRPALIAEPAKEQELAYRLTTLPARPTLWVTAFGIAYSIVNSWFIVQRLSVLHMPIFVAASSAWFEASIAIISNLALVLLVYHTIHQLSMIRLIHANYTRIDLFNLPPLYAFSRLTAQTAIGWIALIYLFILFQPNIGAFPIAITTSIILGVLALATFIWPLLGIHQLLNEEKSRAKVEVAQRLKNSFAELHRRIDMDQIDQVATYVGAMGGLKQEMEMLDKIPTWPWQFETLRNVLTAILLPVLLWFINRLLEHFVIL
jgi:hypothetical protein